MQNRRGRSVRRLVAALGIAALTLTTTTVVVAAPAHAADRLGGTSESLANGSASLTTSDNVVHVHNQPGQVGISGCFMRTEALFVTSGLDSVKVFDVSNPALPVELGAIYSAQFENEAMSCGERRTKNGIKRFALIGVDLYQLSEDPSHYNVGGNELVVVDVTDPFKPVMKSRLSLTTGAHTVACVDEFDCRVAYSSGGGGEFSVVDLRNLAKPKEVDAKPDKDGVQPFASPISGHKWNFDAAGYGIHTGRDGTAMFDVSKPREPRLATTTGKAGRGEHPDFPGWNDFIHHNSARPNAQAFKKFAKPSVRNGNVLLVTEEDYEQTDCTQAGSFQSWKVKTLTGGKSAIVPLDKVELTDLDPSAPPVYGFCSAHWFDYHQSGIAAVGFYGGGLQLVDTRNPRKLTSYGRASWGASEVWDAYWVPKYDGFGRITKKRTHLVYTLDAVRGLDVYNVALPGSDTVGSPSVQGAGNPFTTLDWPREGVPVTLLLLALVGSAALRRRAATRS